MLGPSLFVYTLTSLVCSVCVLRTGRQGGQEARESDTSAWEESRTNGKTREVELIKTALVPAKPAGFRAQHCVVVVV